MSYNLKPSLRAIRYYELMTKTSFLELDQHFDLYFHMLYCCLLAHSENKFNLTFDEAMSTFFPQNGERLIEEFGHEMAVLGQFKEEESDVPDVSVNETEPSSPNEKGPFFLSSVIPILVYDCGLDIHYVLDELPYTDINLYVKNSIERKREEMVEQRFWTYLNIAPHLGSKSKIKKPEDLISFTWEKDKKKDDALERLKRERDRLIEVGIIKEKKNLTEEENS